MLDFRPCRNGHRKSPPTEYCFAVCGCRFWRDPGSATRTDPAGGFDPGGRTKKAGTTSKVLESEPSWSTGVGALNDLPQLPRSVIQSTGCQVTPNFGLGVVPKS